MLCIYVLFFSPFIDLVTGKRSVKKAWCKSLQVRWSRWSAIFQNSWLWQAWKETNYPSFQAKFGKYVIDSYVFVVSQRYTYRVFQTIETKLILICVWAERAVLGTAKTAWEITQDLNHDLTFYCTHNQLCVPQYKVNV